MQPGKEICIKSTPNESSSYLFIDATKIYRFKAKVSEMKDYTPCLGNISKDFTTNNMKETRLKVVVNFFQLILILLIQMIF